MMCAFGTQARRRVRLGAVLMVMAALAPGSAARAMQFKLVGDVLVMSGPVVGDDLARLKDSFATDRVKLIVLHNSPGGDLWNGMQLAQRIRDKGLPTTVSGTCESACGLIYLGGVERSFSDGSPLFMTKVGLHGARHVDTRRAMPELGARLAYLIRTFTDDKYPRDLLDRTVYPKDPSDIVYAFHPRGYPAAAGPRGVMECVKQPDTKLKCTMIEGLDAIAIGVLTTPEVLALSDDVKAALVRP